MTDNSEGIAVQPDPFGFVEHFRSRGQSFAKIAREIPFWRDGDPNRRPLTGRELKRWFDEETARRQQQTR